MIGATLRRAQRQPREKLNKKPGDRIRCLKIDAENGKEVFQKTSLRAMRPPGGEHIELGPEELEAVAIERKRAIEID